MSSKAVVQLADSTAAVPGTTAHNSGVPRHRHASGELSKEVSTGSVHSQTKPRWRQAMDKLLPAQKTSECTSSPNCLQQQYQLLKSMRLYSCRCASELRDDLTISSRLWR